MEIVVIGLRVHQPRKKRYAVCSIYRDRKTYVHVTVGGRGLIGRLIKGGNKK